MLACTDVSCYYLRWLSSTEKPRIPNVINELQKLSSGSSEVKFKDIAKMNSPLHNHLPFSRVFICVSEMERLKTFTFTTRALLQ